MEYAEQIRLRTLLKDDIYYRQWFQKPPTIHVVHHTPPWRLLVQKEKGGRWYRIDLPTYLEAYAAVRSKLSEYWDMTIHCKPQAFKPPVVRVEGKKIWNPIPEGHVWCGYCRRPTVFKVFINHPNSPGVVAEGTYRCTICGVRENFLKPIKNQSNSWPLLVVNRS